MSHLQITDNHREWIELSKVEGYKPETAETDKLNLLKIANTKISNLSLDDNPSLLIFPEDFKQHGDEIGESEIISMDGDKISTGNIMGFVGVNDTQLSIRSRFANFDSEDYFLHYMLKKVFSINLFDLKTAASHDQIFDFLLYLFPHYLKKALSQGLFKKYRRFEYSDANVRGTINVPRHIRQNVPFHGAVSYTTREHSYDNEITQLVRHTIEYIKAKQIGKFVLSHDEETKSCVSQIVMATPTYSRQKRSAVINKNLRPLSHPYFWQYTLLQKLCMQILRHESIKFGKEKDKVYGVLFDGAWLWEEYLYTALKDCGFKHPQNKIGDGGIRMFSNPTDENYFDKCYRRIYPDFYKESEIILDAKYKRLNGKVSRDDLYQVVSYMHCMKCDKGGYIYPDDAGNQDVKTYQLAGYGGEISVIPFHVPQTTADWNDFVNLMSKSEEDFKSKISKQ